jgi:hypothetical protein
MFISSHTSIINLSTPLPSIQLVSHKAQSASLTNQYLCMTSASLLAHSSASSFASRLASTEVHCPMSSRAPFCRCMLNNANLALPFVHRRTGPMWQPGCWRRDNDYNDYGKGRGGIALSGRPGGGMRDGILLYEITEAARNLLWYKPALEKPAKNPAGQ